MNTGGKLPVSFKSTCKSLLCWQALPAYCKWQRKAGVVAALEKGELSLLAKHHTPVVSLPARAQASLEACTSPQVQLQCWCSSTPGGGEAWAGPSTMTAIAPSSCLLTVRQHCTQLCQQKPWLFFTAFLKAVFLSSQAVFLPQPSPHPYLLVFLA